ncbi:4Fe-4S double cluster binding domain-containing protein [Geoglobus acetivorans]|uniref:Iron-sulfur cluster-binding protein n=1 Tax=Geoglobus acetivorans TaxID=565033 RepID=A0A0A7GDZ3_GEOAI|nr:Iron-sulfur cluster-binding protein [Geoglobus acetivorans]
MLNLEEMKERLGIDVMGVADLDSLRSYSTYPENLLEKFTRGIVIGVRLNDAVFDGLPESRSIYARQYQIANDRLDHAAFEISREIEKQGFKAMPVPASRIIEGLHWRSYISHKAIARAAGVGWIGKNLLLVTKEHGPRIRMASILTDMPLVTGEPVKRRCGKCRECIENCIVGALRDSEFEDYPVREDVFDVDRCAGKLKEFASDRNIGAMVCGICIKVCPWGKRR